MTISNEEYDTLVAELEQEDRAMRARYRQRLKASGAVDPKSGLLRFWIGGGHRGTNDYCGWCDQAFGLDSTQTYFKGTWTPVCDTCLATNPSKDVSTWRDRARFKAG